MITAVPHVKCIKLLVLSVVWKPKFLSNLMEQDLSIVENVIESADPADIKTSWIKLELIFSFFLLTELKAG